jgi:hypothetical protein
MNNDVVLFDAFSTQARVRESLVNLLTAFGQRVGLPKSPSVSFDKLIWFQSFPIYLGMKWPRVDVGTDAKEEMKKEMSNYEKLPPCVFFYTTKTLTFKLLSFNPSGTFHIHFMAVVSPCSHTLLYLKWVFYVDHHTGKVISPHQPKFKQKKNPNFFFFFLNSIGRLYE